MRPFGDKKHIILYIACLAMISIPIIFRGWFSDGNGEGHAIIVRPEEPAELVSYRVPGDFMPDVNERDAAAAKSATDSINSFAFDMYKELSRETTKSVFFSPQNVSAAFVTLYEGSGEATRKEIGKIFRYRDSSLEDMNTLATMLSSTPERIATVEAATSVWPNTSMDIKETWAVAMRLYTGTDVTKLDYGNDPEASGIINRWAEAKTRGRIKNLVEKLDADTAMVLTSAVYFKSRWDYEFPKENTKRETFYCAEGTEASADIMHRRGNIGYCETEMFQAVRIPYKKNAYSMIAMLPRNRSDLGAQLLAREVYDQVLTSFAIEDVELYLPRFRAETKYELSKNLSAMGLERAFSDHAEFPGITDNPIRISKVIHKAFIEVDEKQTEATAITAVIAVPTASVIAPSPLQPKIFRADHPFIYFIVENRTNAILFMGRYSRPE
ncbi:MAG: serpin family protein [Synergistaceae bacterium]|jgi:serpin B|nr:serpin family protein [Synergistaceae bacterium]